MAGKKAVYEPLTSSVSSLEQPLEEHVRFKFLQSFEKSSRRHCRMLYFVALLALLVISNGAWALAYFEHQSSHSYNGKEYYNPQDIASLKPFYWNTPFSNDDKNISSPLWSGLFPHGAGLVSVDRSWAATQSVPKSKQDPAKKKHAVYFVAGLHQMHCVTVVRAALFHFKEGHEQTVPWKHITHCIDSLRQALMCQVDSTLLYTEDANIFGDGQMHNCGDWDALTAWASENAYVGDL